MGRQKSKQKWGVRTISQRDTALREMREAGINVPLQRAGSLPNPRLNIYNASKCNHGCLIATPGSRVYKILSWLVTGSTPLDSQAYRILFWLVTGLNMGVDGVLGPVEDARALMLRAELFVENEVNVSKEEWSRGEGSDALVSSLISIGTDCLLIDGDVCTDGKIKMAAAIAGMVQSIQSVGLLSNKKITVTESVRKLNDILDSSERSIVAFFNKRISCDCLKNKYKMLKETQEKMGKCNGCSKSFELKQLKQCATCQFVQYCSKSCQANNWPEHKKMCELFAAASRLNIIGKFKSEALKEWEKTDTEESVEDFIQRILSNAMEDPSFRRKYDMFDLKMINEHAKVNEEEPTTAAPENDTKMAKTYAESPETTATDAAGIGAHRLFWLFTCSIFIAHKIEMTRIAITIFIVLALADSQFGENVRRTISRKKGHIRSYSACNVFKTVLVALVSFGMYYIVSLCICRILRSLVWLVFSLLQWIFRFTSIGREGFTELWGFNTFCSAILSWVPPLIFVSIKESAGNLRIGLTGMIIILAASIAIALTIYRKHIQSTMKLS